MIITPSLQTTADISNSTYNCTANNQHNPYKSRILTNILTFLENYFSNFPLPPRIYDGRTDIRSFSGTDRVHSG